MTTVTSSKYFSEKELACSHCGVAAMNQDFLTALDSLRELYGPLIVTSGYRCPEHPIEKAKSSGPGAHSTGRAVDLAVSRGDAYRLLSYIFPKPKPLYRFIGGGVPDSTLVDYSEPKFTGIGINQKGTSRFIHLDNITDGVRPTIWSY